MADYCAQEVLERAVAWAKAHRDGWRGATAFDGVVRAIFARATKTFGGGVALTALGYGPQAAMLTRSLIEDAIVAYWAVWLASPDWVVQRISAQADCLRLLNVDASRRYEDVLGPLSPADEERLRAEAFRYEVLFGKRGEAPWWAHEVEDEETAPKRIGRPRSMHTLLVALEQAAPELAARSGGSILAPSLPTVIRDMRMLYDTVQRRNNAILHQTGSSLLAGFDTEAGSWREGPSADDVKLARGGLYIAYEKLVFLASDRLNPAHAVSWLAVSPDEFAPFIQTDGATG